MSTRRNYFIFHFLSNINYLFDFQHTQTSQIKFENALKTKDLSNNHASTI